VAATFSYGSEASYVWENVGIAIRKESLKIYLLGGLANMLGLFTFIFIVYLGLATVALVYTTVDEAAQAEATGTLPTDQSALELIGGVIVSSVRNGLKGLWDARLGFVIFGVLGVFAAWAHQIGLLLYPRRAWLVSFSCMAVIITVSIITWIFAQREEISLWLAESPELYYFWRDIFITSYATDLLVSLIFALTITYPVWAMWRWWYTKLMAWSPTPPALGPAISTQLADLAEYQSYSARLHELKREASFPESQPAKHKPVPGEGSMAPGELAPFKASGPGDRLIKPVAILFVLGILLIIPIKSYYDRVALQIQHDRAFVDAKTQPHQAFVVEVKPETRKIRVVNFNGLGTVSLGLSQTGDDEQIPGNTQDWSFEWRSDELIYTDIPLTGLKPGNYYLHFLQKSGWGYFEYTLSHGGGRASSLSALALGFLIACSLVLGLALVFLVVARNWQPLF
jgi:hypothetical protein